MLPFSPPSRPPQPRDWLPRPAPIAYRFCPRARPFSRVTSLSVRALSIFCFFQLCVPRGANRWEEDDAQFCEIRVTKSGWSGEMRSRGQLAGRVMREAETHRWDMYAGREYQAVKGAA